jgi:hypothetical protein
MAGHDEPFLGSRASLIPPPRRARRLCPQSRAAAADAGVVEYQMDPVGRLLRDAGRPGWRSQLCNIEALRRQFAIAIPELNGPNAGDDFPGITERVS